MSVRYCRAVLDTNVVVSFAILPRSIPGQDLRKAAENGRLLLASTESLAELEDVLRRDKFDRFATLADRMAGIAQYRLHIELCAIVDAVHDCRDPKDNKILELALSGRADLIVTGDFDLLCLHPWRGIAILSPADYLAGDG